MPEIVEIRAEPLSFPMQRPFESARRRLTEAENVLVTVHLSDGSRGYGEASPTPYVTGESRDDVLRTVTAAAPALTGQEPTRVRRWAPAAEEALSGRPTARSAVEMALLDAASRAWGLPLWRYFGGAGRELRTDLSIPITGARDAGEAAAAAFAQGYGSLKIKVGGPDREEDLERVLAVSRAAPGARIRLDANQAFGVEEALAFVGDCVGAGVPVELLEQPVPREDLEGLAAVTQRSPVPVIADEAVVDARAALRLAATGAAHGINIKLAKAGLLGALEIIAIARAAGMKLMLGCMMESLLGIAAAAHLAAGTGAFDYLDLDSHTLIGLAPTGLPFTQDGDRITLDEAAPGIGWQPQ
jgi:L-Ala-D/L-Glu epimerase